jgi:4-hydroxy-tetrahydrodipicolinate reductase
LKICPHLTSKNPIIIDFSRADSLNGLLRFADGLKIERINAGVVLCTTGHTQDQLQKIADYSKHIPIFMSGNMSLGINLLENLVGYAAKTLGKDYNIEIIEQHHNEKVDAPSGTALMLARAANETFDNTYEFQCGRKGNETKRKENEIGIHSIRGGTVVGKHEVIFLGQDETITITHEASSRNIFANGAIRAAEFLLDKPPRIYTMSDLIADNK